MPCSVSREEKEYYENLEAKEYLEKNGIEISDHFKSNSTLCELCGTMTKKQLIENNIYEWYLRHLAKDLLNGSHKPPRLISEILRIEQERV